MSVRLTSGATMENERYIETPVGPIFLSDSMLKNPELVEECMVGTEPDDMVMVKVLFFRERPDAASALPGTARPREAVAHLWLTRERFLRLADEFQLVARGLRGQPPGP